MIGRSEGMSAREEELEVLRAARTSIAYEFDAVLRDLRRLESEDEQYLRGRRDNRTRDYPWGWGIGSDDATEVLLRRLNDVLGRLRVASRRIRECVEDHSGA